MKGNQKLNLAFVAHLFNTYPALEPSDEGLPDFDLGDFDETREEKSKWKHLAILLVCFLFVCLSVLKLLSRAALFEMIS